MFKKETKYVSFSLKSVVVYLQVCFTKIRKEQAKSPYSETYFIMKFTEVERFRQVGLPFLSNMS